MEGQRWDRDWVTGQGLKAKWGKDRAGTGELRRLGKAPRRIFLLFGGVKAISRILIASNPVPLILIFYRASNMQ